MVSEIFDRTRRLIGEEGLARLQTARVLVFGLGGVGSYVCEALARAGVGTLGIVDRDVVAYSNINRQIIALFSTVGLKKTEATAKRLADINPSLIIKPYDFSFEHSTKDLINFADYDYIVDAIDTIKSKTLIAINAKAANVPLISSMSTGFRLDPSKLKITDIFNTQGCPLARQLRNQLRKNNIDSLKVVYSDEPPQQEKNNKNENIATKQSDNMYDNHDNNINENSQKNVENKQEYTPKTIASISFVPSIAGLLIASEVVRSLIE